MLDVQQHAKQVSATRQVIEATKQVEYRADYEKRAVDALQMMGQDCRTPDEITHRLSYFNYYELRELNLEYSIGPAPDRIGPDTVPHILLEGYYKMEPDQPGRSWKRGQVTARWTGRDCGFRDIQVNEGVRANDHSHAYQRSQRSETHLYTKTCTDKGIKMTRVWFTSEAIITVHPDRQCHHVKRNET